MRIDKINSINQIYKAQMVAPAQKVKPAQKDQVTFSSEALEIQNAYKAAKASPDIRADKVAGIKEQIKSGTYNLKAKETSEAIVSKLDIRG